MAIEKQALAQPGGFSFSSGASQSIAPVAGRSSFLEELVPGLANVALKYAEQQQDNAFVQGQADHLAGQIQEQSWWTQKAYDQGQAFEAYTKELGNFPETLKQDALEAVNAGEDLQGYTKRIQPKLAAINNRIGELGLTGKAKEQAQKQLLGTLAISQQAYIKKQQDDLQRKADTGIARINSVAVQAVMDDSADTGSIGFSFDSAYQNSYDILYNLDPKNAQERASKNVAGAIGSSLALIKPGDPRDVQRLRDIESYLNSDAGSKLSPDILSKLRSDINSTFKNVRDVQDVNDSQIVQNLELREASGDTPTMDELNQLVTAKKLDVQTNKTDANSGQQFINKIYAMQVRIAKTMGDNAFLWDATPQDLIINGKTDADKVKSVVTSATKQYGNDVSRTSVSVMNNGQRTRNMAVVKAGADLAAGAFLPAMTMTGAELKEANDGIQGASFVGFVGRYQSAVTSGNLGMQNALLDAIPTDQRAAFELYLRQASASNVPVDLRSAAPKIQQLQSQLKDFEARGGNRSVKVQPDDLKAWFGQAFSNTAAEFGHQPSDTVLQQQSNRFTEILQRNMSELSTAKGYVIHDAKSAMNAMIRENMVMQTQNGLIAISPGWAKAVGIQGVAANSEQLSSVVEKERADYVKKFSGRVRPDDVYAEVVGTDLILTGYDKAGNPQQRLNVPAYKIKGKLDAEIQKFAQTGRTKTIALGRTNGRDFPIKAGWGIAFGNNELGALVGQHLSAMEGYVASPTQTDTRFTKDKVIGIGINLDKHPEYAKRAIAAGGDIEAMAQLTADFAKDKQYKNWNQWVNQAGLPSTVGRLDSRYNSAYIGLADAAWHGGEGGAAMYAKALSTVKTDRAGAFKLLKESSVYKQSGTQRRKYLEQGLYSIS